MEFRRKSHTAKPSQPSSPTSIPQPMHTDVTLVPVQRPTCRTTRRGWLKYSAILHNMSVCMQAGICTEPNLRGVSLLLRFVEGKLPSLTT